MQLTIHPLTLERWPDLEALFSAKGCSIPRGCWCMYYRESGRPNIPADTKPADFRRKQFKAVVKAGPPPGLLGYLKDQPVGWVALAPRDAYPKLARSPVAKPVDALPVWSIVCFVVAGEFRHQGAATALLKGAIRYAKQQGATLLEAYPVDKAERGNDEWMWNGTKSMFDAAGFAEVARRKPARPVVRLALKK